MCSRTGRCDVFCFHCNMAAVTVELKHADYETANIFSNGDDKHCSDPMVERSPPTGLSTGVGTPRAGGVQWIRYASQQRDGPSSQRC